MNSYWMAALNAPLWLVLVGGLIALVRYRRRAPRAVGLALPFVALTALMSADGALRCVLRGNYPRWLTDVSSWLHLIVILAWWVILPVAVMADRNGGDRSDC